MQPHESSTSVDTFQLDDDQLRKIASLVVKPIKEEISKVTQLFQEFSIEQRKLLDELQTVFTRSCHLEGIHKDALLTLKMSHEEGVKIVEAHIAQHFKLSKLLHTLETFLKRS